MPSESKILYRQYCQKHSESLPVFYHDWYLDAVCGSENWSVAIAHYKGEINGVWPYLIKKKWGVRYITMPLLTPGLGPWMTANDKLKTHESRRQYSKVLSVLIDQLPRVLLTSVYLPPEISNALQLFHHGFDLRQRYTYRIDLKNESDHWNNISSKQRNIIRKASKIYTFSESTDIDLMYKLQQITFQTQNKKVPYRMDYLRAWHQALSTRQCGKIWAATTPTGDTHAMIYIAHDERRTFLMGIGSRTEFKKQGAIPFLIWESIKYYISTHEIYDFEGSMIPSIEYFFSSFGGDQTPYTHAIRASNKWTKAAFTLFKKI